MQRAAILRGLDMTLIDSIGALGGTLTTLCWLPQAVKALYHKDTKSISLPTFIVLAVGIVLWVIYGIAIADAPLVGANAMSLAFVVMILIAKLRYG